MVLYHVMREEEKEVISAWQYEGDCAIYNLPPYEVQKERKMALGDPERAENFHAYYDDDILIGFTNLSEGEKDVSIGIGVAPKLCGQGYGLRILSRAAEIAQKRYPGKILSLEVRAWNQRAIHCYEKAGFQIEGTSFERTTPIGKGTFYRMSKKEGRLG